MSSSRSGRFDRTSLRESLSRWFRTEPDPQTHDLLNEWLMDLVLDPLGNGGEDAYHPGVFFGRVAGTNVGVTYVPDVDQLVVYVTNIA